MKTPVLEPSFNRLAGFKTCKFLKKRLQHRCFPVNIGKFLRTLILMKICEQPLLQFLLLTVNISSQELVSALNSTGLLQSVFLRVLSGRLLSYLKKRKISRNCHSLPFVVIRCTTRCHSLYHSLSLVASRCHSLYHSLSLYAPLVVTLCTTRLSFYKRSYFLNEKCIQVQSTGKILKTLANYMLV